MLTTLALSESRLKTRPSSQGHSKWLKPQMAAAVMHCGERTPR